MDKRQKKIFIVVCLSSLFCIIVGFVFGFWVGQYSIINNNNNGNNNDSNINLFGLVKNNSNLNEQQQLELTKEAEMKCLNKFCCTTSDFNHVSLLSLKCQKMTYLQCLNVDNECIWKCDNNPNNHYNNLTFSHEFVGINDKFNIIELNENPQSLLKDDNKTINEIDPNLKYVTMDECGTMYEHYLDINSINIEIESIKNIYLNGIIESTKESKIRDISQKNKKRRLGILGNDDRHDITKWISPYHRNVYMQKEIEPSHIGRCSGAFITQRHIY